MASVEPDGGLSEVEIRSGGSTITVGELPGLVDGVASVEGLVSVGAAGSGDGPVIGISVEDGQAASAGLARDVEVVARRRARSARGDSVLDDFGAFEMMVARVGRG